MLNNGIYFSLYTPLHGDRKDLSTWQTVDTDWEGKLNDGKQRSGKRAQEVRRQRDKGLNAVSSSN